MFLRSVEILRDKIETPNQYPYNVRSLQGVDEIELTGAVTFFVGENGSGKSTLLEGMAHNIGFNTAGGSRHQLYESASSEAPLGDVLRLSWMPKITEGFFLRAESFFNFSTYLDQQARENGTHVWKPYGGKSLHEQSHGEAFLSLFLNRFKNRGIYLLDEPEAALSPARQLAFLRVMHELVSERRAQFVIATHSPILLGYPNAQILNFDTSPVSEVRYEETDHYLITKRFVTDRESFLKELLS